METIQPMAFYSPDHPRPFTPNEHWGTGLTSPEDLRRLGFIAIFDAADYRTPEYEKWAAATAPDAERIVMTTRRFTQGRPGPSVTWHVFIAAPGK
jgi:hypothetical protein